MNRRDFLSRVALPITTAALLPVSSASASDDLLKGASREDKDGWIILRLTGTPKEIGYQHGFLAAAEIDDAIKALKTEQGTSSGTWTQYRSIATKVFAPKVEAEYREEMQGIADGVKAKGYAYDFTDILTLNAHIEIGGYYLPSLRTKQAGILISGAPMACSAFVATAPYTADGKIVMGHNFWWGYLMGQRWRVLLDVKPAKGQRFLMDTLPGLIHSGTDFAVNAAGILITETTIGGFSGFDPEGIPEFVRMRKATQYSTTLDECVRLFVEGNNGGYANTWLLGDTKRNEIGKLELGLKNVVFSRSKSGYYIGANYPEDPNLMAQECVPGASENPSCVGRRKRWNKLIEGNKGKIDAEKAKAFLGDTFDELTQKQGATNSTLCGRGDRPDGTGGLGGACNTKVITSEMASRMTIAARMGFSDGSAFSAQTWLAKHPNAANLATVLKDIPAYPWIEIPSAFGK